MISDDLSYQQAEGILRRLAEGSGPRTAVDARGSSEQERLQARYRNLVEGIPAVTFLAALDGQSNELYVSPQIEQLLGFSQREWLDDPVLWYTRLHPDDRERWHMEFAQTCATAAPFRSVYRFLARDGRVVWVQGEARVVRDSAGRPLFLQGVAFDITDRKTAEDLLRRSRDELEDLVQQRTAELARANRELQSTLAEKESADRRKDEFLAMLGHELRNPLAGILNSLEVLRMLGRSHAEAESMLAIIGRQASHMNHIIDDLLEVTRITHGKIVLKKNNMNVGEFVRRVAEDHRRGIEAQASRLQVVLPEGPIYCECDPTRLSQVLDNLLTNAAKFLGDPGEITVIVRPEPEARRVAICVRDTGIGMDARTLRDIFQPFVQAGQSLDRGQGGLGLGLALVKGLVELHGGQVAAASRGIGQGAEFTVYLPSSAKPAPAAAVASPAPASDLRRRVLVIDDVEDASFAMKKLLELDGHEVVTAGDGSRGLTLARELAPEIVLCDIGLPGMDGFEVASALRAEPSLRGTYLVAVSGYGQEEDRQRARNAGFDHHLTKPVSRDRLRSLLDSLPRRA